MNHAQLLNAARASTIPLPEPDHEKYDLILRAQANAELMRREAKRRAEEDLYFFCTAKHRERLEAWEAFCHELGEAPADVALAWLLHQDGVTAPIVGPRTMAQLEGNLHALEIELSSAQLERLDELFPGPGGRAPEAYAW